MRSLFWILHISGWTVFWLTDMLTWNKSYMGSIKSMIGLFLTYLSGFLASLLFRYIYRRIRYQEKSILFLTFVVIFCSFVASNVLYWVDIVISIPLWGWEWGVSEFSRKLTLRIYMNKVLDFTVPLIAWSAIYFGVKIWLAWQAQKERTEKAQALAQDAQLQMLRYQLNPHFLFNALNSIRALISENKKCAKTMITELSEFLRYSLIGKEQSEVPLKHEMNALQHYFAIQKKRYEEKLEVHFEMDPQVEDYPVLSFLVQPLVENAIKYGMKTSDMPLQIWIRARLEKEHLFIEVQNTGKWIEPSKEKSNEEGTGTGLDNIRQRLDNTYPNNYQLDLSEKNKTVLAVLKINRDLKP